MHIAVVPFPQAGGSVPQDLQDVKDHVDAALEAAAASHGLVLETEAEYQRAKAAHTRMLQKQADKNAAVKQGGLPSFGMTLLF